MKAEEASYISRGRLIAAAVLFGLVLYGATCAPGVSWHDTALYQFRIWQFDLRGELSLPLAHPLYILCAKAFTLLPLGDFAYRVNLFSVLVSALCLGLMVELLLTLTNSRLAAIVGVIVLAVSHTFWTHAVVSEVYNLYALSFLAELRLLLEYFRTERTRWLLAALFLAGASFANHVMVVFQAPAYLGVVIWALARGKLRARQLPIIILVVATGALPYLALVANEIVQGRSILSTLQDALLGRPQDAKEVISGSLPAVRQCAQLGVYLAMNFPTPLVFLAPFGAVIVWGDRVHRRLVWVSATVFAASLVFALRFQVRDNYVYLTPCYVLIALYVGAAIPRFAKRSAIRRLTCIGVAILPVAVYEIAPAAMQRWGISTGVSRRIPFRDNYSYFVRPRKNDERGARTFAVYCLEKAAPDGLLIADSVIKNVLVFVRDVEGVQPGVALQDGKDTTGAPPIIDMKPEAIQPFVERGVAYVCGPAYVPDWLRYNYDWVEDGLVYRLKVHPSLPDED